MTKQSGNGEIPVTILAEVLQHLRPGRALQSECGEQKKRKHRGTAHSRKADKQTERAAWRLEVALESACRTCDCPAWQLHAAECPECETKKFAYANDNNIFWP